MNQFQGLRLTHRGRMVLLVLALALFVSAFVAIVDHLQADACREAQATGTQWRIDRVCEVSK